MNFRKVWEEFKEFLFKADGHYCACCGILLVEEPEGNTVCTRCLGEESPKDRLLRSAGIESIPIDNEDKTCCREEYSRLSLTGTGCTAFGYSTLQNNTEGTQNVSIGSFKRKEPLNENDT